MKKNIPRSLCFRLGKTYPSIIKETSGWPVIKPENIADTFENFKKARKEKIIIQDFLLIWTDFKVYDEDIILKSLPEISALKIPQTLVINDFMMEKLKNSFFKTLFSSYLKKPCDILLVILTDYSSKDYEEKNLEKLFSFAPYVRANIHMVLPYKKREKISHPCLWFDTLNKNNLFIHLWNEEKSLFPEEQLIFLP